MCSGTECDPVQSDYNNFKLIKINNQVYLYKVMKNNFLGFVVYNFYVTISHSKHYLRLPGDLEEFASGF